MSFLQFPKNQYFAIADTGFLTELGAFNLSAATDLKHILLTVFMRGVIASPFTARLGIYSRSDYQTAIISSDWATFSASTLVPSYSTNWVGTVYFDFNGEPLNPNIDYYLALETSGYTRVGETFYLGVNLDWTFPVNTQLTAGLAGARMQVLGLR